VDVIPVVAPPDPPAYHSPGGKVKTGRLLKFHRPGGDVQAYVYREGDEYRAAVFVVGPEPAPGSRPAESFSGDTEAGVESEVRDWVERHYPRPD
jgi:hypothetical protein